MRADADAVPPGRRGCAAPQPHPLAACPAPPAGRPRALPEPRLCAAAAQVPGQPTDVAATIGASNKRTVSVAFTAPSGSPSSYLLYSVPSAGSSPVSGTSSPIVWTGGSDGDGVAYKFYVTASVRKRSPLASRALPAQLHLSLPFPAFVPRPVCNRIPAGLTRVHAANAEC